MYVYIFVRRDPNFVREGYDVLSQEDISFAQAALGCTVLVNTIDGRIQLKIPAGTQTGTVFRIKGHGIPVLGSSTRRGDHHVRVNITTPKRMNAKQKELLREFAKAGGEKWLEESETEGESKSSAKASTQSNEKDESLFEKIKKKVMEFFNQRHEKAFLNGNHKG